MNNQTNLFGRSSRSVRELPPEKEMYRAFAGRNPDYDGTFVAAIQTTGIFCRPACPARTPNRENVTFFHGSKQALEAGYRPCKRCKPLQPKGQTPEPVASLLNEVQDNPTRRWTDAAVKETGLHPGRLRKWFKRHHRITFHGYLQLRRIARTLGPVKHEEKTPKAAVVNRNGEPDEFKKGLENMPGTTVSQNEDSIPVYLNRITTPLGPMLAGVTENALCLLEFIDRRMLETQLQTLQKRLNAAFMPGSNHITEQTADQLTRYFNGSLKQFSINLKLSGTDFQQKVWRRLQAIPYGQTRSYKEQAQHIGKRKAVRAVARANGKNRIAVVIPCHRVIGSDGSLTGYGGGLRRKKYLLELEQNN